MQIRETLLSSLDKSDLDKKFDELIACLPQFSDIERKSAKDWFGEKVASVTALVEDIVIDDDEQELFIQLSTIWLQMRLEWNLYNLQMQYQTMSLGQAKPWLMIKGSCLSYLVEMMEGSIDSYRIFWLSILATDPILAASNRTELIERMLTITQSIDQELQVVASDIIQIRDHVSKFITFEEPLKQFHAQIESLLERTSTLVNFTVADFKNCIEATLVKGFAKESLRFVLNHNEGGDDFHIRPEISQVLLEMTGKWIENLVQSSLERSVEERLSFNKSQHININWSLTKKDGRLFFLLSDDGVGKNPYAIPVDRYRGLQLEGSTHNKPTEGSSLEASVCANPISLYCVASVDDKKKIKIAFEANEILSVESSYKSMINAFGHPCVTSESNETYILVQLSKIFESGDIKKATYVFLKTKESKSQFPICLELSSVEGFTHASLAAGGSLSNSPFTKGFFIYRQEVITILDTKVMVEGIQRSLPEVVA